jgi:hypothetical protein
MRQGECELALWPKELKVALPQNVHTKERLEVLSGMPAVGDHNADIRERTGLAVGDKRQCNVIEIADVRRIVRCRRSEDVKFRDGSEIELSEYSWRETGNRGASVKKCTNVNGFWDWEVVSGQQLASSCTHFDEYVHDSPTADELSGYEGHRKLREK